MAQKKSSPYGSWPSPITADLVLSSAIAFSELIPSSTPNNLYWIESRPSQAGRNAIVSVVAEGGEVEVIADEKWNARTRVHEYGGGSVAVVGEGKVVFSSIDGPLYQVEKGTAGGWGEPKQISPESSVNRYADFSSHPKDPSIIISILEDHTIDLPAKVVNSVVVLVTSPSEQTTIETLVSGTDFYSCPRLSPSGNYVCFISWTHPDMPWDGSSLYVAPISITTTNGIKKPLLGHVTKIAGGADGVESVSQPRWSLNAAAGEEQLVFLSDRSGFYELYKWGTQSLGSGNEEEVELLMSGLNGRDVGGPDWVFNQSTHRPLSKSHWISSGPKGTILLTNISTKSTKTLETPYASISSLLPISETKFAVISDFDLAPSALAILTVADNEIIDFDNIKVSSDAKVDEDYISVGSRIEFDTGEKGEKAYGIWYEPNNKRHCGVEGTKPPLIVHCHGGPTSSANLGLSWSIQYFTSRGFAYVDVDYSGSSTYGREFRKRLEGNWGVVDVNDTIKAVEFLVQEGKVDGAKVGITGGSAGGFTVLASLCAGDVFSAGCSQYGISDLVLLAGDTHKFESQYLFRLLGGTPLEVPQAYHDRSPINNSSSITAPLLILQGSIDRVVPPEQATKMAETIRSAGGKCELIVFPGEGHGFRKAENKKKAYEAELKFYRDCWEIEEVKEVL